MKDLYLVTGAAGHLGLTVVEELRKEGKTVRALVLPGDKAAGKLPEAWKSARAMCSSPPRWTRFSPTGTARI